MGWKNKRKVICGIYIIIDLLKNRIYVGQRLDIYDGWVKHLSLLRNKKHHSSKLQNYYNKYGSQYLEFHIIHPCQDTELDFWEIFYIKCFDSYKNGFNMTEGGKKQRTHGTICKLKNRETGKIDQTETIIDFSRKYSLDYQCVVKVCHGELNYIGDWYNPEGNWKPEIFCVIDPKGIKYIFSNISKFARNHGLKPHSLRSLVRGACEKIKGWTRENSNLDPERGKRTILFSIIDPNGVLHEGKNITKFARDNNIPRHYLTNIINGGREQCAGWRKNTPENIGKPY